MEKELQKKQNEKKVKKQLLPQNKDLLKGIDFRKYRVAAPHELNAEPIKDEGKITSTAASSIQEFQKSMGFGSIMER